MHIKKLLNFCIGDPTSTRIATTEKTQISKALAL